MAATASLDCLLQRSTGTYASPVWDTITKARSVTINYTRATSETSSRAAKVKTFIPTMGEFSLSFDIAADDADTDYTAFATAFAAGTVLDMRILRGPASVGTKGYRAQMVVSEMNEAQDLEDHAVASITMVLADSANTPLEAVTLAS